jgi:protoporphyrinogen oxidase
MGQLYERLAGEVVRLGGEVRRGAHVIGLETVGDRVTAVRFHGESGPERIAVGELLSTIALPELVRTLAPARAGHVALATQRLTFRSLVFLNIALRRDAVSENTWMYVASGRLRISRIQEPKRRSPSMAPPGRTSMMLEIPCDVGDEIWTADTATLLGRFSRELSELGFAIDDAIDAFVVRVEHGYPVYHLGYDDDRRALLATVERFANVRTAGRQGLFRYVFMDAAMQMGIEAARQMAKGERSAGRLDAIGRAKSVLETAAITA